jgi:hypothetical protein
MSRDRFDVVDQEQLAAQVVAIMDAHFRRPGPSEKQHVLELASQQIAAVTSSAPIAEEDR